MKSYPKVKTKHGYIIIFVGYNHHLADCRGYAYEHRLVAEKKIGRKLKKGEQVHHIDNNGFNNSPDNLEVVKSFSHHKYLHRTVKSNKKKPDEPNVFIKCACGCGNKLRKYDKSNRLRKYISGHNTEKSELDELILSELKKGIKTLLKLHKICDGWTLGTLKSFISNMVKNNSIVRVCKGEYGVIGTPKRQNPIIECACGCKTKFNKYDSCWRERKFISGHN